MSLDYIVAGMAVFLRTLGVVLQLPTVAGHPIPVPVRIGICMSVTMLLVGLVPSNPVPLSAWRLAEMAAMEVLLGLAMGFTVRMIFAAVEMAGRIMTSEIGLAAQPGMGVPEPASEPLPAILSTLAIVLFFLSGAHHDVLTALARSFHLAPAGGAALNTEAGAVLLRYSARILEIGFRIAAPFIAMNFLVTLSFSILSRAVPKMQVFIVSMSARALIGLSLLAASGSLIARYLYSEFGDTALRMLSLLPAAR